jgi:lipopolysaccharide transport system ATP-binding protein
MVEPSLSKAVSNADRLLIALRGVGKDYPIGRSSFSKLGHFWSALRHQPQTEVYSALKDVNLEVRRGESLGLVGVNGAGKSTLLKIIAGVVKPTQGDVVTNGSIGALLELGAGFHPEYSGRHNIDLACALMGMDRAQTLAVTDDILAFADIGSQIDQPVKHYSSGMVVRLGFAVATARIPDILITDEVLAVGDESFQKKCTAWMERYLSNGGTLLLCSHSMYHIQKLCKQAAWIQDGKVRRWGDSFDVTRDYLAWHEVTYSTPKGRGSTTVASELNAAGAYQVQSMQMENGPENELTTLPFGSGLHVSGTIYSPDGRAPGAAVGFVRLDGTPIYGTLTEFDGYTLTQLGPQLFAYSIQFDALPLLPGRYVVRSHAMDPEGMRLFDHVERQLEITGSSRDLGFCHLPHQWLPPAASDAANGVR